MSAERGSGDLRTRIELALAEAKANRPATDALVAEKKKLWLEGRLEHERIR